MSKSPGQEEKNENGQTWCATPAWAGILRIFFLFGWGKVSHVSHIFLHIVSFSYCFSASISYLYLWQFLFALRRFLGFIAFLLLSITLDSFAVFPSFLGGFCFPHFQWAFVWLSDLPWLVVLFLFFFFASLSCFLETKGKSFWCYLLRIFSPYIIIIFFFFLPRRVWVETLIGIKSVIWATHKF